MSQGTAWAFLVVSSDRQAETLPDQEGWARRTAAEHGWLITRTFSDTSTGKHGARKLLDTLLSELRAVKKSERPARVLMTRLDRTGRGLALEPIAALAEIYRLGVVVHTREDGDNTIERASDSIKPILRVLTGALENEARRDKAVAKHAEKRAKGHHAGHAPYGTVLVDGKPIPYEPEAAIIRDIFKQRADGWGIHRITRAAAQHAPPKRKRDGTLREMAWNESTVARMLASRTYRDVVVPADLWDAVQGVRQAPIERDAKYPWPLRGAVRCTCGKMLSTSFSGPKRYRKRYYVCRNVAVHPGYPYHDAAMLERQFADLLRLLRDDPDLRAAEPSVDLDELRARRHAITVAIGESDERKRRAWEVAEAAGIEPADLRARIEQIAAERRALEGQRDALDAEIAAALTRVRAGESFAQVIADAADAWATADDVGLQREAARAVAAYVGGLFAAPPESRGARATVLLYGADREPVRMMQ